MMMGHGSYGHGGSSPSSTSNLSPLAPPFTVDRFGAISISNPLVDLSGTSYGVIFSHSLHNWIGPPPPNSMPDYFSSAKPELDSMPSNAYAYSSSTEFVAPLNSIVPVSVDTGFYGQNSSGFVEAKPYYPSYVSSATGNGNPLDIPHNCGCDLLSASHVATPDGSSHENYTQSLSGLEHSAHWAPLWEGLTNWQQSEHVQLEGNFCATENYLNPVLYSSEGVGKFEEASHSINTVGMEKQMESGCKEQLDYERFLSEVPKFTSSVHPTSTGSASSLQVPETCPSVPSLKPVSSWNHQMPYGASYEKCLRKHDVTPDDVASIINSSPAIVIRQAAQDTSSLKNKNTAGNEDYKAFSIYNPSVVIEPHPFTTSNLNVTADGDNRALFSSNPSVVMELDPFRSSKSSLCYDVSEVSNRVEQNEQVISGFFLEKNREPSRSEGVSMDSLDQFSGKNSRIQLPCASLQGLDLAGDKNEGFNSAWNHSDSLDHYNPAVDSPCWKGAPVTHFPQYEMSETLITQSNKNLEAYRGPNIQVHPVLSLSGNDTAKVFPEKTSKNLVQQESWSEGNCVAPLKTPMVDDILLEEGTDDTVKAEPHHTKPNCFDGVKITDDSLPKKSFNSSDSKLPRTEQQSCEGGKQTSEKSCLVGIEVGEIGKDDPDDCSSLVPFHAIEHVLCSPPSANDAPSKFIESHGGVSAGKVYVRTLIDTMQNLSQLLVFHFSNDACELKKDDHEDLKDVINNLELCMLQNVERTESATSQPIGEPSKHKQDPKGNGSQIFEIHPLNVQDLDKIKHVPEEDYNDVSGKNNETLSNIVFTMAAADVVKDDKMIQALKKALIENFHGEDETEPEVLLYKNLWLEAEASLCAANCVARFNQMKNEMSTPSSQNAKENVVVMDKLSRSEDYVDPNVVNMSASDANGSPFRYAPIPESPILSPSSNEDDVAARCHILKCWIDTSNTENTSYADNCSSSAEKLCTSEGTPIRNGVDKLAVEEKSEMSIQDTPMSSIMSHGDDDVEASVIARFRLLRQCVDNMNSVIKEEHQAPDVDLGYVGLQRQLPTVTDRSEYRLVHVDMEPHSSEDKLGVKELPQIGKDATVIQCQDGSSDWEHVLLEEIGGQSS